MPLYEYRRNAENTVHISDGARAALVFGTEATVAHIAAVIAERRQTAGRPIAVACDGWYGVDWPVLATGLAHNSNQPGLRVELRHINTIFKSPDELARYKTPFITDDPAFGMVNKEGTIADLLDAGQVASLLTELAQLKSTQPGSPDAMVVFGCGAAAPALAAAYDLVFYFDKHKGILAQTGMIRCGIGKDSTNAGKIDRPLQLVPDGSR